MSDDPFGAEGFDLAGTDAEPFAEDFGVMLAEHWRGLDARWRTVETNRPRRNRQFAGGRVLDLLHDPAFGERGIVQQLERIEHGTRQHTKEEAMKIIGGAGVPAGAVFDTLELLNDPSLAARGIMQKIEHPTTGKLTVPAWPVRFDGAPPRVKPSPLLGQHNGEILGQWLGIAAGEVEALRAEGIV